MIPTFLINLDGRPDRLATATSLLRKLGVEFERMRAVEPAECEAHGVGKATPWMSSGELACVASHLSVYDEVIRRDLPAALILEDDVAPNARFTSRLAAALDRAPADWAVLQVGWLEFNPIQHRTVSAVARSAIGPALVRANRLFPGRFREGTHCYVVSNAFARYGSEHFRAASAALDLMIADHSTCWPLDGHCFIHLPSLAGQDDSVSDLAAVAWRGRRTAEDGSPLPAS